MKTYVKTLILQNVILLIFKNTLTKVTNLSPEKSPVQNFYLMTS